MVVQLRDVTPVEDDAAFGRLVQPDDRATHRGFAAAGLTHQTHRLAAANRQRDVVDGADVADVTVEQEPALDREVDLEMLELDERASAVRAHAVAAARVRSHSSTGTGLKHAT